MTANELTLRTREDLMTAMTQGFEPEFLFFWGHRKPKDGSVTKSCLSQWFPAPFTLDGKNYATEEHYMMASKARLFEDWEIEKEILSSDDPSAAKKLGRRVHNYDDKVWKERRFEAVVEGNIAKFSQNESFGAFLKNTGQRILVEASPVDRIWGIGLSADHEHAPHPDRWRGPNLLGFALMEARQAI